MRAMVRSIEGKGGQVYDALLFCCPGCAEMGSNSGLHMLPVNTTVKQPSWDWDGNLDAPTVSPSIRTRTGLELTQVCHSFLRAGVFEFLGDCTHSLAGQHVPMPDIPDWLFE